MALVPERRQLKAALAIMDLHQERYLQFVHRLESWLARHWPELPTLIGWDICANTERTNMSLTSPFALTTRTPMTGSETSAADLFST